MKLFDRIRDFNDSMTVLVILMDDREQLRVMRDVLNKIGRDRCNYVMHKNMITTYMMEIRLPYNRYLAMMKGLTNSGWTLTMETKADILSRMVKRSDLFED